MSKTLKIVKVLAPTLALVTLLVVPVVVFGQVLNEPSPPLTGDAVELADIESVITRIGNFLIAIGVIIAVIFIIIGGIKYMAAGGDAAKAGEARTTIINGLIGAMVVLGVGVLLSTAGYVLDALSQGTL
ncbi:MAG: hypothetical protein COV29_04185 [Candidatus Yanofskybacteria bacterium CG10_big_fil_rev_8_21_14_0_10_36_16]|uniref:Uncharacterized protein n=1 Tax=Candidatus Yanofskybacteria bacterium CG10_big_fil_rev_8_21_14_0_10_36_16 TaxID=1975096 RepID=A0A2J0Q6C4_9BACT|nr:MAG: hypothetical protein COV29_04185 [Candidatus Yanofskybacteria bacterium CG10_big_fil_rev_8_21_14_0_10_36_16]